MFKSNNLGLALGRALKFYSCVAKGLKLKHRKFLGLIPTFVKLQVENWQVNLFAPPALPHLNRIGNNEFYKISEQFSKSGHICGF